MKRSSGVLMHVSSLWGDYSEGSFGENAKQFIDIISECGFSYWQVLPFCLPDEYDSPYKSYSAFSGNPFFIDLPKLYEIGLITAEELEEAKQKTPYSCEFERLHKERMPLLAKASHRFTNTDALNEFLESHPHTEQFCRFMALKAANNDEVWQKWTISEPDAETLYVWEFTQYIFYTQWKEIKNYANEKGISIIGDIPIYVAADSADVWASPEQFQLNKDNEPDCVAGVPPDYFCEDGQLWGNPLYNWKYMKKDNFSWWRERIRFMSELFDGVRIDHFRGLESYFSIAATEKTAKNGKWVKGPGMSLIKALKEECGENMLIIAEDLGDITDDVRKLVKDSGFPGMRVFQFAFLSDSESPHMPHNYIDNCVAYTGTHDNNTLLGYVWELDEASRKRMTEYCGFDDPNWDKCYDSILRTLFSSSAGLLILPVQDVLLYGSDTRLNTPGSCGGNWSYRLTREQLESANKSKFNRWNEIYGRK